MNSTNQKLIWSRIAQNKARTQWFIRWGFIIMMQKRPIRGFKIFSEIDSPTSSSWTVPQPTKQCCAAACRRERTPGKTLKIVSPHNPCWTTFCPLSFLFRQRQCRTNQISDHLHHDPQVVHLHQWLPTAHQQAFNHAHQQTFNHAWKKQTNIQSWTAKKKMCIWWVKSCITAIMNWTTCAQMKNFTWTITDPLRSPISWEYCFNYTKVW